MLAVLPVVAFWSAWLAILPHGGALRIISIGACVVPSYVLFALALMPVSAVTMRLAHWRTPPDATMRIADMQWPLLDWARAMVGAQLVRVFCGTLFRGTPIWSWYLRLAGAHLGHRVYVNSLGISDYNLLTFGDDVVIGADVHLSGHTVEGGLVKTGGVMLGRDVTVGLCSIVEIGVIVGSGAQIGAMSFVPKHTRLDGGYTYAGVPAKRLDT